jgi:hypothetical protein
MEELKQHMRSGLFADLAQWKHNGGKQSEAPSSLTSVARTEHLSCHIHTR